MVRLHNDGEYGGGGTAGEDVGKCPIGSGMTGTRRQEIAGSSAKMTEIADGWPQNARGVREKGRNHGWVEDLLERCPIKSGMTGTRERVGDDVNE